MIPRADHRSSSAGERDGRVDELGDCEGAAQFAPHLIVDDLIGTPSDLPATET
jgi:hypothetical protein